jgi:hypothetical protein
MEESIIKLLTAVIPAVVSSVLTYMVASKKSKTDVIKTVATAQENLLREFTSTQTQMREELRKELELCQLAREDVVIKLGKYKNDNEYMIKQIEELRSENAQLKRDVFQLESKLQASEIIVDALKHVK